MYGQYSRAGYDGARTVYESKLESQYFFFCSISIKNSIMQIFVYVNNSISLFCQFCMLVSLLYNMYVYLSFSFIKTFDLKRTGIDKNYFDFIPDSHVHESTSDTFFDPIFSDFYFFYVQFSISTLQGRYNCCLVTVQ